MSQVWAIVQWALALSLLSGTMSAGMSARAQESVGRIDPQAERNEVLEVRDTTIDSIDSEIVSAPEQSLSSVSEAPLVSEMEQPATTVEAWIAQIEASLVQITGVRVETTEAGLQVILEAADGALDVPETRSIGNALIADIPNATIAEEFSQAEPIEGIALVSVTSLPDNRVRVAITGTDAPPVAEVTSEAQGLVLAVTLGDADAAAEEDAIQVVVTGEQDEGYNPSSASTATRTDTPLRDTPFSIQVVPRQLIEDRNVRSVIQATETVSSVLDSEDGTFRTIRGFDQAGSFRNGYRDDNGFSEPPIATVERVEVLRGPASVLFGAIEPGGIINVITRRPLDEPYYEIGFEAGNYDFYQPNIDLTGPIDDNGNVLYRFIASYQSSGSFVDFIHVDRTTIAPSLTINLGERTSLNLYYEYYEDDRDPFTFVTFTLSDGSFLPRSLYAGYPISFAYRAAERYGYELQHEFSDNWQIRNNLAVLDVYNRQLDINGATLEDDRFLVGFGAFDYEYTPRNLQTNTELIGEFNTGSIAHQVLVGFDFNHLEDDFQGSFSFDLPPLDTLNPNYDVLRPALDTPFEADPRTESYGLYLQDQIAFSDSLKMLIGARYDWVSYISESTQSDGAFSPQIGLVYQPSDTVSLYASYSRSFRQTTGFNPDGSAFEPTRGTQYEVGIKTDWLENRLSATLAAYHITRTNVTTPDPVFPLFSTQTGEQRSQGIELDITGQILPGWNIAASYAYTDAIVIQDNEIPEGNRLRNVPFNQASLWTTYELQEGSLRGLGFGLGLFYVGERQADLANSFTLEDYFRTDAAVYFRRDRFQAAINIRNLFDIDYAKSGTSRNAIYRGDPFTITGSVRWTF